VKRTSAAPALLLAAVACGKSEGVARIELDLPEEISTFSEELTLITRVEHRSDPLVPGAVLAVGESVRFSPSSTTIEAPRIVISHGDDRVAVVEIRRTSDRSVAFYGVSEPFSLHPGDEIVVHVPLGLVTPPSASVHIVAGPLNRVSSTTVDVLLESDTAVEVEISNLISFAAKATERTALSDLPRAGSGDARVKRWDLDRGLEPPCGTSDHCPREIFVRFIDPNGYESATTTSSVVVDTAPPRIVEGSQEVDYFPGRDVRRSGEAASSGSMVRLSFALTEPVPDPPAVAAIGSSMRLDFERCEGLALFVCWLSVPELPEEEATLAVKASATDFAGNGQEIDVADLLLDGVAPAEPATDSDELRVVYERRPWARDVRGEPLPRFEVIGGPSAVEPGTTVLAIDREDFDAANIVSSTVPPSGADGSFGTLRLTRTDRRFVWIVAIDAAGNLSDASDAPGVQGSLVRHVRWFGELGPDAPATQANPHLVELVPSFSDGARVQRPDTIETPSAADVERAAFAGGGSMRAVGRSAWTRLAPAGELPGPRDRHALAYDRDRGRAVLFGGGDASGFLGDLWEWDGVRWSRALEGTNRPSPRAAMGMVYDAARGETLLFGGTTSGGPAAETWTWDGARWGRRSPPRDPGARFGFAIAYDSQRGRVVLFGGSSGAGLLDDTWEWDGRTWLDTGARGPPARRDAAMAFDERRGRMVLFGGASGTGELEDTWELAAGSWSQISMSSPQGGRQKHVMGYDEDRAAVISFGGERIGANGSADRLEDAWEWSEAGGSRAWRPITWAGTPPSARAGSQLAYDSTRHGLLLFGGFGDTGRLGDLVLMRAGRSEDVTPGTTAPGARRDAAIVLDRTNGELLLFGGHDGASWRSDTWRWNGVRWSQVATATAPPLGSPVLSEGPNGVVLFGEPPAGRTTEIREWDRDRWIVRDLGLGQRPPMRGQTAIAFDPLTRDAILFGGHRISGATPIPITDGWRWDGSAWTALVAANGLEPAPRFGHAMIGDPVLERVVLFGGLGTMPTNELWELDGARSLWAQRMPASPSRPSPRTEQAIGYDESRARVVITGGADARPLDDVWEWNGDTAIWRQVGVAGDGPEPRVAHAIAYHPASRSLVVHGGCRDRSCTFGDAYDDTWSLSRSPGERPAIFVAMDSSRSGESAEQIEALELDVIVGGRSYDLAMRGDGREIRGARALLWNARVGRWEPAGASSASPEEPTGVHFDSMTNEGARSFVGRAGQISLAVTSSAGMGNGPSSSEVALDGLELVVRYRLDDQ
jgi:hypothetical protein